MLLSSSHSRPRYTGLTGSSDALALAQYAERKAPLVVIAANAQEAQRLVEEIPFFGPELRVHLLPDWETLPYDHFSPHQDLISERLATLHHVHSLSCDVLVVPVTTALYPLSGRLYLLPQARRKTRPGQISRADDACRLQSCAAGAFAR
jgi:transcription-repair coupling factor (superfamily II helicase)